MEITKYQSDSLRNHRRPSQWRSPTARSTRALKVLKQNALHVLPKPTLRPYEVEGNGELDLTSSRVVVRPVTRLERQAEIGKFVTSSLRIRGVSPLRSPEVSLFDRTDFALAIGIDGMYTNTLERYLLDFAEGYPENISLRAFVNRAVIMGAPPHKKGSRYVGLSLEGEGAGMIIDERTTLRGGIKDFPHRPISVPHFSLLETKDQLVAEELKDNLAKLNLNGSEVLMHKPDVFKVEDTL